MQRTSGLYIKYRVLVLTMNISGRSLKNITKVEIHKNYLSFSLKAGCVWTIYCSINLVTPSKLMATNV